MATSITAVQGTHVRHALLLDITVDDVTYYISTAYNPITYLGNTYTQLGAFLNISALSEELKANGSDVQISLSGIPQGVIYSVLEATIKGGTVNVYRAFFNDDYTLDTNNVFKRYAGVITNFSISESIDIMAGDLTNTVTITVASIHNILQNRVAGQRTNSADRDRYFPGDTSFKRVSDLHNTSFDFGMPYTRSVGIAENPDGYDDDFERSFR